MAYLKYSKAASIARTEWAKKENQELKSEKKLGNTTCKASEALRKDFGFSSESEG